MDEQERGRELKAAGAELLPEGRSGLCIRGWFIEAKNKPILNSPSLQDWEKRLGTSHMPEMVFGDSSLELVHIGSGIKIHFNAFEALHNWKQESLPPVEVPAAAKWKFRSKPVQQVILDYDYTFTTPYCGSEVIEPRGETRVMPNCWFLLLRFWLRVDGVLMRLRDCRMYCPFGFEDPSGIPLVLHEICWREGTFQDLAARGFPSDSAAYSDPNHVSHRLPILMQKTQKLHSFQV
ncbi:hypothetical protein AMTRI_Chr12g235790 [Amborella trichopoda]